ncbi:TPA: hypothetical protein N0F65_011154 [Lagenidium giganteum]|uniref:BAR domain-containing protein n=1 Tax=Lagenidium giganteum TaxID=4803 RepID=A0AAV2Z8V1_9STRA|nr:TPA: hypothetical protein N0F65_011154 [Lagenidium giganteum]
MQEAHDKSNQVGNQINVAQINVAAPVGPLEPASPPTSWSKSATTPEANSLSFIVQHSKLLEVLRCSKRRLIQQILVKLRQVEVSSDAEYDALKSRQLELHAQITSLMLQMKAFVSCVVSLGYSCAQLGGSWSAITGASSAGSPNQDHSPTIQIDPEFDRGMRRLDTTAREIAGTILTAVIPGLQRKLDAMAVLKKEMNEREKLKLDFDSAVRKLRVAKERRKPDDVLRRDLKLQAARASLDAATGAIVKKCGYYETARSTFIYRELRQFRELQAKFFGNCAVTFQPPQLGPEMPALLDRSASMTLSTMKTAEPEN